MKILYSFPYFTSVKKEKTHLTFKKIGKKAEARGLEWSWLGSVLVPNNYAYDTFFLTFLAVTVQCFAIKNVCGPLGSL